MCGQAHTVAGAHQTLQAPTTTQTERHLTPASQPKSLVEASQPALSTKHHSERPHCSLTSRCPALYSLAAPPARPACTYAAAARRGRGQGCSRGARAERTDRVGVLAGGQPSAAYILGWLPKSPQQPATSHQQQQAPANHIIAVLAASGPHLHEGHNPLLGAVVARKVRGVAGAQAAARATLDTARHALRGGGGAQGWEGYKRAREERPTGGCQRGWVGPRGGGSGSSNQP